MWIFRRAGEEPQRWCTDGGGLRDREERVALVVLNALFAQGGMKRREEQISRGWEGRCVKQRYLGGRGGGKRWRKRGAEWGGDDVERRCTKLLAKKKIRKRDRGETHLGSHVNG